ncbi:cell wall hydrolase [Brevibacillus dissolubilis]|uniref:cell wall hydrolase n=1 Tax=Brevibacillus dissolubilis TaxID=1844116 RepID=UPI00111752C6|nr:cell wall hydrolase [Brevibacillus dissolubilis]
MNMISWLRKMLTVTTGIYCALLLFTNPTAASAPVHIYTGSTGNDITYLQQKLQQLGLYQGTLDGVVTEDMIDAVNMFQRLYGLPVTSELDQATVQQIKAAQVTTKEIDLLERLVYAEGRGESLQGQTAIAAVVLNRMKSSQFPKTVHEVIFEKNSFSTVQDGALPKEKNEMAQKAVRAALAGKDPSKGAIFFFNPKKVTSSWMWSRPRAVLIGNHIFAH